jgi:hypothetical protein
MPAINSDNPISRLHTQELSEYFDRSVGGKKSEWWRIFDPDACLKFKGIEIPIGKVLSRYAHSSLMSAAARRWLRPENPTLGLADLPLLRKELNLEKLAGPDFLEQLHYKCIQVQQDHPRLRRWIEERIALLEYEINPPRIAPESVRVAIAQRHSLLSTVRFISAAGAARPDLLDAAVLQAEYLAKKALDAAAVEVAAVLGRGHSDAKANLMVPVPSSDDGLPDFNLNTEQTQMAQKAREIWRNAPAWTKCLLIVAESEGGANAGFWTPVVKGSYGNDLPGAPRAFHTQRGHVVFREDLPDLSGFSEALDARWKSYMIADFHEDLFVSLPFIVPTRPEEHSGTTVAGVLNVNVRTDDLATWRRACHDDWRQVAATAAAPFVEVAFHALLAKIDAGRYRGKRKSELLLTDSSPWNALPGTGIALAIEEKKDGDT